ncbi:MAG: PAS domain-containing protein, partial [Deltaproteobacteria bacterium]|nr:PAS domain-containing protein [Deltaproteobacteria bacterium]
MANLSACDSMENWQNIPKRKTIEPLVELVLRNRDLLVQKAVEYIKAYDISKPTAAMIAARKHFIFDLLAALESTLTKGFNHQTLYTGEGLTEEPAWAIGMEGAIRRRELGIVPAGFLGWMKFCRNVCRNLIGDLSFKDGYITCWFQMVESFFDRIELGFCEQLLILTQDETEGRSQPAVVTAASDAGKYLKAFESLPNPIIFVDRNQRIETANRSASRLLQFHLTRDRRCGKRTARGRRKTLSGELIGTYLPWITVELDKFIRSRQQRKSFEKRVETAGDKHHFQVWFSKMRDPSGKSQGIIISLEDVTDQRNIEAALRESEQRFRQLFDNMSSLIVVYEVKSDAQEFIVKGINKSGEQACIMKHEDCIGASALDVFPGLRDMGLFDVLQRVWKTGKPEYRPISFYQDEHLANWYENYVYKLPSGEIVAVFEDVTDRKQAEEALRKTTRDLKQNIKELERANRQILNQQKAVIEEERLKVLLQMAGATAHELNQPLMALLGNIELIGLEKDNPKKVMERITKIEDAGKRIADIVKRILTIRHYEVKPYAGTEAVVNLEQSINVLSVEDSDEDFTQIEASLADQHRINLLRAKDVKEAFRILAEVHVDLIFLDYLLPSGTGLEFMKKMQKKALDIPVVFITGQGDEMVASQAKPTSTGLSDCFEKFFFYDLNVCSVKWPFRNPVKLLFYA